MKKALFGAVSALLISGHAASAGICAYKPSVSIPSALAVAGGGVVFSSGTAAKAAGLYSLTHSTSGLAMLGSTAAGTSAAGTVGIMGGTAGTGAAVVGVVLNPVVWGTAAAIVIGGGALEGGCYIAGS